MDMTYLIDTYTHSATTIQQGRGYFAAGCVRGLSITKMNTLAGTTGKDFIAQAIVRGSHDNSSEVSAVFRDDRLITQHCDCPAYEAYGGLCKHLVALLLAIDERQKTVLDGTLTNPIEDFYTVQLLEKYQPDLADANQGSLLGRVKMTPKLFYHSTEKQFALSFSVGTTRPYIVKSLTAFVERLQTGEIFHYGKDLEFAHKLENFTPDSQFYLDLLLELDTSLTALVNHSSYYISKNQLLGREMVLGPNAFDHFFDYVDGQVISTSMSKLMVADFLLKTGDPDIALTVTPTSENSYQLSSNLSKSTSNGTLLYATNHYGYFIQDATIYRCSHNFWQYVFPVLTSLTRSRDHILRFSREQLSTFIGLALPKFQGLIHFSMDQNLLAELTPTPLATQLYFDYPHHNTVRGKVEFQYGDQIINPLHEMPETVVAFRDKAAEHQILTLLQKYLFSINEDEYMLLGEEAIYEFLTQGLRELLPLAQIMVEDKLEKMKAKKPFRLSMAITMTKGIIEVKFDESKFTHDELVTIIKAYQKGKKYIILSDNTFLDIVNPTAQLVDDMLTDFDLSVKDLNKKALKLPAYRALYLDQLLDNQPEIMAEKSRPYKDMVRDVLKPIDTDFAVPANLHAELRQYQLVGYRWLKTLAHYGFGGILADDMGLGKTIQAIALLLSEAAETTMPSIIIAPTSLIYNWQAELDKFAPDLTYLVIAGNAEQRKALIEQITAEHIVITSYDSLKRDIDLYDALEFHFCIADEAQYIKNHYTQNAQAAKALASRIRFALTGTPMENSLADLWSIMDFVMPGYLLRWQKFKEIYEIPITRYENKERLARLQRQVAPFLLRRVKKDVLKELPDKIETTLYAQLSLEEEKIYQAQLAQSHKAFLEEISDRGVERSQIKILALLMRLRQACCSPSLFLDNYTEPSSKMTLCFSVLEEKIAAGSQVIIFSQFTSMLDLLAAELRTQGIAHLMLTGSTKSEARMAMVNRFNNDHIPIFLISLKAGGVGLNLVAADTVIHFDPWWNISAQNQATDRAHRIGQDKKVHVIKLIAKDTIEEKIEQLQNKKKDLTDAVINEGQTFITSLSQDDLTDLFAIER